jgi:hypothetical protein
MGCFYPEERRKRVCFVKGLLGILGMLLLLIEIYRNVRRYCFVNPWTRRKRKNALENQLFYDQ